MIIGRKEEQQDLLRACNSEYSEFVAVTGRRRIGKTFLIRETFGYKFAFQHSGLANQNTRAQLKEFRQSLLRSGMKKCRVPVDWSDAFFLLSQLLDQQESGKKVVFIDELPWMDAPRSNFVSAIEHFWNGYASARKDILLIICGSATSWIINNVFKNHGGLHNRVTYRINLAPFTLLECEQYAKSRCLGINRYGILEGYMVMGGQVALRIQRALRLALQESAALRQCSCNTWYKACGHDARRADKRRQHHKQRTSYKGVGRLGSLWIYPKIQPRWCRHPQGCSLPAC